MKIVLIKNKKLLTYTLPDNLTGVIELTDIDESGSEKSIVSIEKNNQECKVYSNSEYYVQMNSQRVPFIVIQDNSKCIIKNNYSYEDILMFTAPSYENMNYYKCSKNLSTGVTIGKSTNSTIKYNDQTIADTVALIKLENEEVILSNSTMDTEVFLNNKLVTEPTVLNFGDIIFIRGLKLILLKKNGEYILGITDIYNNIETFLEKTTMNEEMIEQFEEPIEEKEMNLYSKEDYFYRKPRFIYSVDRISINVDSPPARADKNEMPLILTLGPMLTMSMTSVMTFYNTINNVNSRGQSMKEAMPSLIMSGVMMVSFLVWPLVTNAFQRGLARKKEKERRKKYTAYIDSIKEKINIEKNNQQEIMNNRFVSVSNCEKIILNKEDRLWERRLDDSDYLSVSLGYGKLPLEIDINYPEEHFSLTEDIMIDKVNELKNSEISLENVPIPFSLSDTFISAIIGEKKYQDRLIKNILLQLSTFHSYDNLKFAIFTSKEKKNTFDFIKSDPHIWSNDKKIRYFASNEKEYKEVSYQLEKIYTSRVSEEENVVSNNQKFILVVDTISMVRNLDFFNWIVDNKNYCGFSLIFLNDKISELPDQCQTFIEVNSEVSKISRNISNGNVQEFKIDFEKCNFAKCFKALANIPLDIKGSGEGVIPKKVGFLELYNVGRVESFNCKQKWNDNVPILSLSVPVGVGKNGEKINIDLHEKYHGPHGLIAGMTGSGKSEFIITYILSMAVNYHPYEVQFILIDYKGGGLAGAFENQSIGIKLPHLVGTITNLDKNEINRSLASIESELKRRQALFNMAREKSEESTIDIYKYQEMYRNHIVDEPISHLFIIADEFAELKNQQPEFMEQLISTARIGRSLGVHLILATQKPSGVVDSQIWSNTRFRVCLRVQEKGDSTEVIKQPDAAFLTQTGRFYFQVGFNEIFLLGQSAWAGGKYHPSDSIKKTIDTSIEVVNDIGYKIRTIQTRVEQVDNTNYGEELINIVKYLSNVASEENIKTKPLWLSKISEFIYVLDLIKKYNYQKEDYVLKPLVGEYDVPSMQQQRLLTVDFREKGNVLLYGSAGMGKENFISTMIFSSMVLYTPQEVNYYIIDFGSEALKCLLNSPHVGDIMYPNDSDKIENLYKMIQGEILERKQLLSAYNGDYLSYCKESNNPIPNIVVVINNYESYIENYPGHEDFINLLTRDCTKYGIYFILAVNTPNGVRFKLKQNFGQIFSLQLNSEEDYSAVLGNVRKTYPSKIFGRGLIKFDDVYEFQTALVTKKEEIQSYLKDYSVELSKKYNYSARRVPILPELVCFEDCKHGLTNNTDIALGIGKEELKTITYDFTKDVVNIVTSQDISLLENIVLPMIHQYINNPYYSNIIINAENFRLDDEIRSNQNYFESNFDLIYDAMKKYIEDSYNQYKANNSNKNIFDGKKKFNCIIIGINSFKNRLSTDRQNNFDKLFSYISEMNNFNYIIVDSIDKLKKVNYDSWFKENYNASNGIYIGNGLGDQIIINVGKRIPEMKQDVPYNFGFVIKRGIPIYVKFIEKYK